MTYTISAGPHEKAVPVISYLFIEGKLWTDKRRWSLLRMTAFFLLNSIILILHSMIMIVVWIINIHSEKERENKSSMKNFIESPSFPELNNPARKTSESKERSIRTGSRFIKDPTLLILRKSRNSLAGNRRKLRLSAIFYENEWNSAKKRVDMFNYINMARFCWLNLNRLLSEFLLNPEKKQREKIYKNLFTREMKIVKIITDMK